MPDRTENRPSRIPARTENRPAKTLLHQPGRDIFNRIIGALTNLSRRETLNRVRHSQRFQIAVPENARLHLPSSKKYLRANSDTRHAALF